MAADISSSGRDKATGSAKRNLRSALRLIVITDAGLCAPRSVTEVVEECLRNGARAVQLRDKGAAPRDLLETANALRELTRAWNALLFINDRYDVALAAQADGVHLGPDDLPVGPVRATAPPGFLIGHSTDDPGTAARAAAEGADYIGCGAVYPTGTKKDAGEIIGTSGLQRVVSAVSVPVVGIGGITPQGARNIARQTDACGVAVISAVMAAADPGAVVRELLAVFS